MLVQLLSMITSGHSFHEDNQLDADMTCLLQSNVVTRLSKGQSSKDWLTQLKQSHVLQGLVESVDWLTQSQELKQSDVQSSGMTSKGQERMTQPPSMPRKESVALTSYAIKRKSRSKLEPSQGLMGIIIVVGVAVVNFIGVIIAMQLAKEKMEEFPKANFNGFSLSPAMRLNPALVVPQGSSMSYFIPGIQQTKALQAFSILGDRGQQALGAIVNHSVDDPGILLHGSPSGGGAGATVAFVGPHPDGRGKMRIAWPSIEHQRGEMFGTLEPDGHAFKVMREGQLLLYIEGGSQNFAMSTGPRGSGERVATVAPARDNFVELHLEGGADVALAVISYLAIVHLSPSAR